MISPSNFVTRWNEFQATVSPLDEADWELQVAQPQDVQDKAVPASAKQFLLEAGLPNSCAPFLSFIDVGEGLKRVWEVFDPGSWKDKEKQNLKQYFIIGSDSEGNPICIDESKDGRIVVLDHEDSFLVWQFMNSSVADLAECLLVYNAPTPRENLQNRLKGIDAPAMQEGAFWWQALRNDEDLI